MTIKEFLQKQSLDSKVEKKIQFTDMYGIVWIFSDSNNLNNEFWLDLLSSMPCAVHMQNDNQQVVFDLNMKHLYPDATTTVDEVYNLPAKKATREDSPVYQYLEAYSESKPSVLFERQIYFERDNGRDNGCFGRTSVITACPIDYSDAVKGPFSHLFFDEATLRSDNVLIITLRTSARERFVSRDSEHEQPADLSVKCESEASGLAIQILLIILAFFSLKMAMSYAAGSILSVMWGVCCVLAVCATIIYSPNF